MRGILKSFLTINSSGSPEYYLLNEASYLVHQLYFEIHIQLNLLEIGILKKKYLNLLKRI
jgi:hypothetical protein